MAYNTNGDENRLTACPDCDFVQREPVCATACVVRCRRCDALLYRAVPGAVDSTLALTLGAAVFFLIANIFPIMSLELYERRTTATLAGMARALDDAGMTAVALLVFLTLVLMPALEILARLHLLLPLRFGRTPWKMGLVSRLVVSFRLWSMVEVFVLAAVVSMHRLGQIARLELGPALWALGAVMLLLAATQSIFASRDLWTRFAARTA